MFCPTRPAVSLTLSVEHLCRRMQHSLVGFGVRSTTAECERTRLPDRPTPVVATAQLDGRAPTRRAARSTSYKAGKAGKAHTGAIRYQTRS